MPIAQAMIYADMAITMAEHPRLTVSDVNNLLSKDIGYNVVRKVWPGYTPQINHYTSRLMAPLLMSGNVPQFCSLNETAKVMANSTSPASAQPTVNTTVRHGGSGASRACAGAGPGVLVIVRIYGLVVLRGINHRYE